MKLFISILFTMLLFGLVGCEQVADISSPTIFSKDHVHFSYPQNWTIAEDSKPGSVRYILVETTGEAIFIALIYPKKSAPTLNEFAQTFSAQSKQETPIGEIVDTSFLTISNTAISPAKQAIQEKFSMSFLGENIPHIREYYTMNTGNEVAFLISQVATSNLNKVGSGFNLILNSFVMKP